MYDFVIVVEKLQRELDSAALIAGTLKKNGYLCEIVKFPFVNEYELQRKYKNKVRVVLTQSLYCDRTIYNLVYHIFGKVKNIVDLRWEQIFTNERFKDIDSYNYPHGSAQRAYHVCWGEKIKYYMEKAGIKEERLPVTGPVHLDFCRKRFERLYPKKTELFERLKIPQDKKFLLFISSFSYSTLTQTELKGLGELLGKEVIDKFADLSRNSRNILLEWFKELLAIRTDIIIVYRPHPAEREDEVLKRIETEYHNFRVIAEGSILPWIKAADQIYNWFSTSVIEVVSSGKKCKILRPIEIPYEQDVVTLSDMEFITNKEQFFQSTMENDSISDRDGAKLQLYYDIKENELSADRLCECLKRIVSDKDDVFQWNGKLMIKMKLWSARSAMQKWCYLIGDHIYRLIRKTGVRNSRMEQHILNCKKESIQYQEDCSRINNRMKVIEKYAGK